MKNNCCTLCQKQPLKITDIGIDVVRTSRKKKLHLISARPNSERNPEDHSNLKPSNLEPADRKYAQEPNKIKKSSARQYEQPSFADNNKGHRKGHSVASRTFTKNTMPASVRPTILFNHQNSSINDTNTKFGPSTANLSSVRAESFPRIKESAIIEIHSPDPEPFSFGWDQKKNISQQPESFNRVNLMPQKPEIETKIKALKQLSRGILSRSILCQDQSTKWLFVLKQISKSGQYVALNHSIHNNIYFNTQVEHPHIVSGFQYTEDRQKIVVLQQYTPSLLYNQLLQKQKLQIGQIKNYLRQIIEATVILHQNNRAHGQLNPLQIGCTMGFCKIRICLTQPILHQPNFLQDTRHIALLGYQMAYGVKAIAHNNPRDYSYYKSPQFRLHVLSQLRNKSQMSRQYAQLDDFLIGLLEQEDNQRIFASSCLTHPFFELKQ